MNYPHSKLWGITLASLPASFVDSVGAQKLTISFAAQWPGLHFWRIKPTSSRLSRIFRASSQVTFRAPILSKKLIFT